MGKSAPRGRLQTPERLPPVSSGACDSERLPPVSSGACDSVAGGRRLIQAHLHHHGKTLLSTCPVLGPH